MAVHTATSVDAGWERRSGWGGIAFVALVVGWSIVLIAADRPGFGDSPEEIMSFFGDGGDSGWLFLSSMFLALGGLMFLPFLAASIKSAAVLVGRQGRQPGPGRGSDVKRGPRPQAGVCRREER